MADGNVQAATAPAREAQEAAPLPADALILVPCAQHGPLSPAWRSRSRSRARARFSRAQRAVREQRQVGIVMQRNPEATDPEPGDLHRIGTIANIIRYITAPDGTHHLICQGEQRFRMVEDLEGWPFLLAQTLAHPGIRPHLERNRSALPAAQVPGGRGDPASAAGSQRASCRHPGRRAAGRGLPTSWRPSWMRRPTRSRKSWRRSTSSARMERVSRLLAHRIEVLRLSQEIGQQTRGVARLAQPRGAAARADGDDPEAARRGRREQERPKSPSLKRRSLKPGCPRRWTIRPARSCVAWQRMPESAGEYGMVRTYLDWLGGPAVGACRRSSRSTSPPRGASSTRTISAYDKIKRRILEYLAVRKLAPNGKAPILCFVGPPGVGKTSLGQSIARRDGDASSCG